ncbi:MAG: hypothetical protein V7765_20280, partial [Oleispira sp.]
MNQVLSFLALLLTAQISYAEVLSVTTNRTLTSVDLNSSTELVIDGAEVLLNGNYQLDSILMINGASLRQIEGEASAISILARLLVIDDTSVIDLTGAADLFSGDLDISGKTFGGSHGGQGYAASGNAALESFGSYERPNTQGSSGVYGGAVVTRGGGILNLSVDRLELDGIIRSNGEMSSASTHHSGAAGGSVNISTNTILGTGSIEVDGGNSVYGVGGGGGRISVSYETNEGFDLDKISAKGGYSTNYNNYYAGAGTILINDMANSQSRLNILGRTSDSSLTDINQSMSGIDSYKLDNANASFNLSVDLSSSNVSIDNSRLRLAGDYLAEYTTIKLDNSTVSIKQSSNDVAQKWEVIELINNSRIQPLLEFNNDLNLLKLNWNVKTAKIDSTSLIDLTGSAALFSGDVDIAGKTFGGSHGGQGYAASGNAALESFGSYERPSTQGSSGVYGGAVVTRGGGILNLSVDRLELDGIIRSNGEMSSASTHHSGAAGGSVNISTNTILGTGSIEVDGGNSVYGVGGGGGRISVSYETNEGFDLDKISAKGGYSTNYNNYYAGAGTILINDMANSQSRLNILGRTSDSSLTDINQSMSGIDSYKLDNANASFNLSVDLSSSNVSIDNSRLRLAGDYLAEYTTIKLDNSTVSIKQSSNDVAQKWEVIELINNSRIQPLLEFNNDLNLLKLNWNVKTAKIDSTSLIDLTGSAALFSGDVDIAGKTFGGSHGGQGYAASGNAALESFGSYERPSTQGSSGVYGGAVVTRGGGILNLSVD